MSRSWGRPSQRGARLVRALTAMAAAAAGTALAVVTTVAVGPAGADTELEVRTTADDYFLPGAPIPLLVTISADGAVTGTLTASFDGIFGGSQAVDVPGGSVKEVLFVVNGPPWASTMQVTFNGTDDERATARVALRSPGQDEVVAVFPSFSAGQDVPATAELTISLGQARLHPFDPALLSQSSEVLNPFSQVLVSADDLDGLDDTQLRALQTWVATTGGTLVVDAPAGTLVPLDLEPVAGDATAALLGVGRVRFTDRAAPSLDLDGILAPTPSRSQNDLPWGGGFGGAPTTVQLARDAGVRIPAIGSLVAVLVVYGLAVGPVLWLVLRRSQREPLLWALLPAIALVTTAGVWGVGRALRSESSTAHATLVADLPMSRVITTQVLVTSPNGGRAGVTLADGWRSVASPPDEMFGWEGGGMAAGPNRQFIADGSLATDLEAGGVGVVTAETIQPGADPSWAFDLTPTERGLEGTITNLTSHTLEEIVVAAGQGVDTVASLPPGASAEITLSGTDQPPGPNDRLMERLMRNDPWSPNDGVANPGLVGNWLSRHQALRDPRFVLAVGWTRDEPGPLETMTGRPVERGRTAFLGVERVDRSTGERGSGRVEILRGFSVGVSDTPAAGVCADAPLALRFTAGGSTTGDDLVLAVPGRTIAAMDVWVNETWVPAGLAAAEGQDTTVVVPDAALTGNEVYTRVQLSCEFWGVADPFPVLRTARADDEPLELPAEGTDA